MANVIYRIYTKKDLHAIYDIEKAVDFVTVEINRIIARRRNLTPGAPVCVNKIDSAEVAEFIARYPLPLGYSLGPELQERVEEAKKALNIKF